MPATHIPRYPVVDPEPSMTKAMGNFNGNDVAHIGAFASAGYVVGWFGGVFSCRIILLLNMICFLQREDHFGESTVNFWVQLDYLVGFCMQ